MIAEQSTFAQIRALLDRAERDTVAVRQDAARAAELLRGIEQAEALLDVQRGQGIDSRAEEGRASSLRGFALREARMIVRQAQAAGQAQQLAGSPLWADLLASEAERKARQRRSLLIWLGGAAALAVLLLVVVPRVFPSAPVASTLEVSAHVEQGDMQGALALALAEQARVPDDEQIGLWVAALQQQLGQASEAKASWDAARARYPSEASYLNDRVGVLVAVGDTAQAEQAATQLQQLPDGAAFGTYQLGAVREAQQRYSEAIQLYDQASQLADKEDRPQLVVVARARMAALMQLPQQP